MKKIILFSIGIVSIVVFYSCTEKRIEEKIFMPPAFMKATLLSGFEAPICLGREAQSIPAVFKITSPAELPNNVKMSLLEGCQVLAECTGNLASERADCQAVSMHCDASGDRVAIDQKVKGFLVDQDNKYGLHGTIKKLDTDQTQLVLEVGVSDQITFVISEGQYISVK